MGLWGIKRLSKRIGLASWRNSECADQHCRQGSTLLFRDRPFACASGVPKIHAWPVEDHQLRDARDAMRGKETKTGRARWVMFIQSIIYAGVTKQVFHFYPPADVLEKRHLFIYSFLFTSSLGTSHRLNYIKIWQDLSLQI